MTLAGRRLALMAGENSAPLVDTSATEAAFYRRRGSESHPAGARAEGKVRMWYDTNQPSNNDFSGASYTSGALNSTDMNNPWYFTGVAYRLKFGDPRTAPSTTPTSVNLDSAYAFWKETGRIMFAGKNTPFYGMANIDGTLAEPGWSG